MSMEPGLDTGPVLLERRLPIAPSDTAGTLTEKLADLGSEAVVEALGHLDSLVPQPQDPAGATYAAKIGKSEAALDWRQDAVVLHRQVRAFNPFPGAETHLDGQPLRVWESEPIEANGDPGTVIGFDHGCPVVACGYGALALTVIQRPGSRRMPAAEFLKGRPIPLGTRLASPAQGNA
jgi:methionyl-tRNA formyltransferase